MLAAVNAVQSKSPMPALLLAVRGLPITRALEYLHARAAANCYSSPRPGGGKMAHQQELDRSDRESRPDQDPFVWQPTPAYKYDIRYHYLYGSAYSQQLRSEFNQRLNSEYSKVASWRAEMEKAGAFCGWRISSRTATLTCTLTASITTLI